MPPRVSGRGPTRKPKKAAKKKSTKVKIAGQRVTQSGPIRRGKTVTSSRTYERF